MKQREDQGRGYLIDGQDLRVGKATADFVHSG